MSFFDTLFGNGGGNTGGETGGGNGGSSEPTTSASGFLFGTTAPDDANGEDGNAYVDLVTGKTYLKESGSWAEQGDFAAPGLFLFGDSAPEATAGQDGAVHVNTATGDVSRRAAGTWSVTSSLQGPAGVAGQDGNDGSPGGFSFRGVVGAPSNSIGLDGDTAMNLVNGDLYTKQSGSWTATGQSLAGPQGVDGRSALQLWQDAGNTGGLAEFLLSIKGEKGEEGSPGGFSFYFRNGPPADSLGRVGDAYADRDNRGLVYVKQGLDELSATWIPTADYIGGNNWIVGNGDPAGTTGFVDDLYVDLDAGSLIYVKVTPTLWTSTGRTLSTPGATGAPGESAYDVAVTAGFTGTAQDWLDSLVGPSGKSAYELYLATVPNGSTPLSEVAWLASLQGAAGSDGRGVYELAQLAGFEGDEAAFLASLKGDPGAPGAPGLNPLGIRVEADTTGVVDATAAIQTAIDQAHALGGGRVLLPVGTYKVSKQEGETHHYGTASFCIKLKSNVWLEGEVPGGVVLDYERTSEGTSVIVTQQSASILSAELTNKNIGLRNITVDGNALNGENGEGFNYWLKSVEGLYLENINSLNSANWGVRIEECRDVAGSRYNCSHGAEPSADGFHIQDVHGMTFDQVTVYTEGDDAFAITTFSQGCKDITITNVIAEAPTAGIAAGRGFLFNTSDLSPGSSVMENVYVQGLAKNCHGHAVVIDGGVIMRGCTIDVVARNCGGGLYVTAGSSVADADISNNIFRLVAENLDGAAMVSLTPRPGSVLDRNRLELRVRNPADGLPGVTLRGTRWTGFIELDYDPDGSKVSPNHGLDLFASYCNLDVSCSGAARNIHVRAEAAENVINLGRLEAATVHDIELPSGHASWTRFLGGSISGSVNRGVYGRFHGVAGHPEQWDALPTSLPSTAGQPWNNAGDVGVS